MLEIKKFENFKTPCLKLNIILIAYNHEKYIREAIDSILMQNLDFEYKIIVADDCSSDNTLEIIKEYANKHHEKFKLLENSINLGVTKNYQRAFQACTAEYIAILEGDDYWISPQKIKKQINFLDNNKNFSFCFHRFIGHDEGTNHVFASNNPFKDSIIIDTKTLIENNFIGNFSTCVYRYEIIKQLPLKLFEMKAYDWIVNILCSQYGDIGFLNEFLSVYRQHDEGVWSSKSKLQKKIMTLKYIDEYDKFLNFKYNQQFELAKLTLATYLPKEKCEDLSQDKEFRLLSILKRFKRIISLLTPPIIIIFLKTILRKKD